MPIENWRMTHDEIEQALELQKIIKEAGLTWPQLDVLLGLREGTVHEYCRAHTPVPAKTMEQIKEVLADVKAGKIKPPIVNAEV